MARRNSSSASNGTSIPSSSREIEIQKGRCFGNASQSGTESDEEAVGDGGAKLPGYVIGDDSDIIAHFPAKNCLRQETMRTGEQFSEKNRSGKDTPKQENDENEGPDAKLTRRPQGNWCSKAREIPILAKNCPTSIQQPANAEQQRERKNPMFPHPIHANPLNSAGPHLSDTTSNLIAVQPQLHDKNQTFGDLAFNPAKEDAQGSGTLSATAQPFVPITRVKIPVKVYPTKAVMKPQPISKPQPRKHRYRSTLQSEKDKFEHAVKTWSHMGLQNSPFVPRTIQDWVEVKAATSAEKRKLAEKKLTAKEAEKLSGAKINPCMGGKRLEFPGTAVLGVPSIWSSSAADERKHADWPTPLEMKFEGDDRAKSGFGRFLPLPRGLGLEKRLLDGTTAATSDGGSSVPWGDRKLKEVEELDRVWGSEGLHVDEERIYGKAWEIDDEEGERLLGKDLMTSIDVVEDPTKETKTNAGGK